VNLTNITVLIGWRIERYDLRELYYIRRVYEAKHQRIQKLSNKSLKHLRDYYEDIQDVREIELETPCIS